MLYIFFTSWTVSYHTNCVLHDDHIYIYICSYSSPMNSTRCEKQDQASLGCEDFCTSFVFGSVPEASQPLLVGFLLKQIHQCCNREHFRSIHLPDMPVALWSGDHKGTSDLYICLWPCYTSLSACGGGHVRSIHQK